MLLSRASRRVNPLGGRSNSTTMGKTLDLSAGQMLYLAAAEAHALRAVENSSLLLTLVLK